MPPAMRSTGTYIDAKTGKRVAVGPRPLRNALKRPLFLLPLLALVSLAGAQQDQRDLRVRARQEGLWVSSIGYISPTANAPTSPLFVEIAGANTSAFGDIIAEAKTPLVQLDFVYGFNTQTSSITAVNGGVVESSSSRLRLQTGTGATGSAQLMSVTPARYRPGQGMTARFTAFWSTAAANSQQIVGVGDNGDGYFFGYNGTSFGILHKNAGVETWYPQSSWNVDKMDGTGICGFNWDKTKGNVMQIHYPYLGYGDIKFFVQDPLHGHFSLAHIIRYANSNTAIQLTNPALKFKALAKNTGNTTNLDMYVGSVGMFLTGKRIYLGPQFSEHNQKAGVTTETNIITFKNATTYNGIVNTGVMRLRGLSVATDGGNALGVFHLTKNATVAGSPSWVPVSGVISSSGAVITSGQSAMSYDVIGSTVSGGTAVFQMTTARNSGQLHDLTNYNIFLYPGETITISGESGGSAATMGAALSWNEDN